MSDHSLTQTGAYIAWVSPAMMSEEKSDHPNDNIQPAQPAGNPDEELRARIHSLLDDSHAGSECFRSSRPILIESVAWMSVGLVVWIVGILIFS